MKYSRTLFVIITAVVLALAITACDEVAESIASAKLHNGTYTLDPRPGATTGVGGVLNNIYVSKVQVDNQFIRIYFHDNAT